MKEKIAIVILALIVSGIASVFTLDSAEIKKAYCESSLGGK